MRLCSIDACGSKHYGKDLCFKHYYRQYKHGNPHIVKKGSRYPIFNTLKESFESKFEKGNVEKCWNWKGAISHGYGSLRFKGKHYIASRAAYEVYISVINDDLLVCHKCDNPLCVNPNHLFLGTELDNMKDMVSKNRSAKGSHHSQAKLNETSVKEIKKLLKQQLSHSEIAKLYDVKREAISKINQGIRWGHIQ